jgi:UPF0271 protein
MSGYQPRPLTVDVNADLGERPAADAEERAVMPHITSVNIACGVHAGSPDVMRAMVELARFHEVAIGAHPGFADRAGGGRREIETSARQVESLVAYQVGALAGIAAAQGSRLRHVKPHGALYNLAARDRSLADAVALAVRAVDRSLVLFGLAGSASIEAGRAAGLATASEVFADRAYRRDGSLVPRQEPGAVLHDADEIASRALTMIRDGAVVASDGATVEVHAETICIHGDTPGAPVIARRLREALASAGIVVRAVGSGGDGGTGAMPGASA